MNCILILQTYGPYLSTLEIATIRKLFAARTTLAECSALVIRNCHAAQLGRVYGPRSCNSNTRRSHRVIVRAKSVVCYQVLGSWFQYPTNIENIWMRLVDVLKERFEV